MITAIHFANRITLEPTDTSTDLLICHRNGDRVAVTLSEDDARVLVDQLHDALRALRRVADPYHGKRLTISVCSGATVEQIIRWRTLTWGDGNSPIYPYALYVLEDLRDQVTNDNIAEILAWGEANPGHPFVLTLSDEATP